jgi:uncharacterized protein YndB with AHSA1/START domain
MSNTSIVVVEKTYRAPSDKVWKALTDRQAMKQWYFDIAEFRAEEGFEFQFTGQDEKGVKFLHLCRVKEVVPGRKLSYTWRYEGFEGDSLVTFELFGEGESTRVKLTHEGLETFPVNNPAFARANFEAGWNHLIGISLKDFVEKN